MKCRYCGATVDNVPLHYIDCPAIRFAFDKTFDFVDLKQSGIDERTEYYSRKATKQYEKVKQRLADGIKIKTVRGRGIKL